MDGFKFAFGCYLPEEVREVVSGAFGLGKGGRQCGPGGVGQDAVGLVGDGLPDGGLESLGRFRARSAVGEVGQDRGCGLLIAGVQVGDLGVGGGCLLLVAALLVLAGGGDGQL
ncbi:hypothetical protein ABZX65_21450 [Streptomyces sp. NPDC003300]|uniref:hypothetical protein n=1 Tax=unclassified Streptomyces TaxID=2593676 RepID=UPI0033B62C48